MSLCHLTTQLASYPLILLMRKQNVSLVCQSVFSIFIYMENTWKESQKLVSVVASGKEAKGQYNLFQKCLYIFRM